MPYPLCRDIFCCVILCLLSAILFPPSFTRASGKEAAVPDTAVLQPMQAVPAETTFKPGLQATYFLDFFARDVRKLPTGQAAARQGRPGPPILQLDHQFGREQVFDSGTNRGVGIRMTGALHFDKTGEYRLQALSNDGIILYIDGRLILSDPKQHSDRLSSAVSVKIASTGWYSLAVDYFQRKGTAALKLFWQLPGNDTMEIVPATAFGHIPPN